MNKVLIWIGVCIVLVVGAFFIFKNSVPPETQGTVPQPSKDTLTLSGGDITLVLPVDFGLATSAEQVPVKSYIPPCSEGFEYCFYYNNPQFQGTNFESAGLSIRHRAGLSTQDACVTTMPDGYNNTEHVTQSAEGYRAAMFAVGDAGAGHYASGKVYRIALSTTCYEFETRIGETQFANYSPGSIKEFTATDRATVELALARILEHATLSSGATIVFPQGE